MATPDPADPRAYKLLVEQILDYGIFLLDQGGHILTWNAGAQRIKGYRRDEIVGKHFSVFYPREDIESHKPEYELRVAAADGRFEDLGWRVRKDGSKFFANVIITALHHEDGSLAGFAKVTRDITERKQAEEALRESEERYRMLVDSVKDYAIFLLDASGRVRTWNVGAERIKGYSVAEIVGEHISRFYTPAERERGRPQQLLARAAKEGRVEDEGWRVRKDGTRFWADVVITAIYADDGSLRGFSKVTRDLTEQRESAAERSQLKVRAQETSELNRDLEAFSYTVAHDLRAPIRGIVSLADYLKRDHAAALPPSAHEMVDAIERSAEKMAHLVEDLLNFSRSTKGDVARARVDITALARHIHANTLKRRDPARLGRMLVDDDIVVEGDPGLLRIALENLLSNAWKFTRERPAYEIRVGKHETRDAVTVFVRDNGAGFPPERTHELFEPFRRLHTQEEFEGTGVGLATVRRVVERHGGTVAAESQPGVGATFSFTLPKRRS